MSFSLLKSKLNLFQSKSTLGLIRKATINNAGTFNQNYRQFSGSREHSTTIWYRPSSWFNRFNHVVNIIPSPRRGVGFFLHAKKGNNRYIPYRGFKSSVNKIIIFSIICSIVFGSVERVPYSNKLHLVFSSDMLERYLGTALWEKRKEKYKKHKIIVNQDNPEAIRVKKIMNVILDAMHKGLSLEHGYTINAPPVLVDSGLTQKKVKNRRRRRFGLKYGTKHLEGLNWEVMLLNFHADNAFYLPSGKIGVYMGAVKGCSDSEIAATIAHEIGHGVARHLGEPLLRTLWRELEADHIGLILMASAGYDPRAAPDAYCKDGYKSTLDSTHPSAEKRAKRLDKAMSTAVAIYEQVQTGQQVKSFI